MSSNQQEMINSQIKSEDSTQIVYCDYGYIIIDKADYANNELIHFINFNNDFKGTINKANILTLFPIKLKTLYGEHKLYIFEVSPYDSINSLITKLHAEEEKDTRADAVKYNKGMSYRIISSKGGIKELDMTKKFYQEKIIQNQILLLAPDPPTYFSDKWHGNGISIENKLVANKVEGDEYELAFINKGYNSGSSLTEFYLQTEPAENSVMIGVSLQHNNYYLIDHKTFWGYALSEGKKTHRDIQAEYGCVGALGDKIGVQLNFQSNGTLSISFLLNDINLGIAFDNLPKNTYYPCAVLFYEGAKVKVFEYSVLPNKEN